jgi:hypothetical protein
MQYANRQTALKNLGEYDYLILYVTGTTKTEDFITVTEAYKKRKGGIAESSLFTMRFDEKYVYLTLKDPTAYTKYLSKLEELEFIVI